MLNYLIKRLLLTIPVLLGIVVLLFVMLRSLPGDPAEVLAGVHANQQEIELLRHQLGLDRPLYIQFFSYLVRVAQLDLGVSTRTEKPVIEEIRARLPNTILLAVNAMLLACILGIPAGIISAIRPYSKLDYVVTSASLFGISMPVFWLGLIMIMIFSIGLQWLPAGGIGTWKHAVLPSVTVGLLMVAFIARMTRASMLEALNQDYINTARAKGLFSRTIIIKHALKNALIPVITVVGIQFGTLLGGAVLAETVFAWPGTGRLLVDSILSRDYPVIQGTILTFGLMYVLVNIMVDMAYSIVDPRIRYE